MNMVSVDKIGTTGYLIVTLKSEFEVFESMKNRKPLQCSFLDGEEEWRPSLKENMYVSHCIAKGRKGVFDFLTVEDIKNPSLCRPFAWRFYMDGETPRAILYNILHSALGFD